MSRNGDKIVVDREEMKSQKNAADWRGGGGGETDTKTSQPQPGDIWKWRNKRWTKKKIKVEKRMKNVPFPSVVPSH